MSTSIPALEAALAETPPNALVIRNLCESLKEERDRAQANVRAYLAHIKDLSAKLAAQPTSTREPPRTRVDSALPSVPAASRRDDKAPLRTKTKAAPETKSPKTARTPKVPVTLDWS